MPACPDRDSSDNGVRTRNESGLFCFQGGSQVVYASSIGCVHRRYLISLAAALVAKRTQTATILTLILVVVAYQLAGSLFEWAYTGSLSAALQDVRLGIPGLLLQVFGGWLILRKI